MSVTSDNLLIKFSCLQENFIRRRQCNKTIVRVGNMRAVESCDIKVISIVKCVWLSISYIL